MNAKIITVRTYHSSSYTLPTRTHDYSGTLEELIEDVFGYTLECGNSWNPKIPRFPKTAKSLVNALNKSAEECHRYNDSYELIGVKTVKDYAGRKIGE